MVTVDILRDKIQRPQGSLYRVIQGYTTVQFVLDTVVQILHMSHPDHRTLLPSPIQYLSGRLVPQLLRMLQSKQDKMPSKRLVAKFRIGGIPMPFRIPMYETS